MVHARHVRPPFAGATLVSIDEGSVRNIPGLVKVVSKGNYLAVVCEREENAIRAARQLKAVWQKPATAPFPASSELFKYMRAAAPSSSIRRTLSILRDSGEAEVIAAARPHLRGAVDEGLGGQEDVFVVDLTTGEHSTCVIATTTHLACLVKCLEPPINLLWQGTEFHRGWPSGRARYPLFFPRRLVLRFRSLR